MPILELYFYTCNTSGEEAIWIRAGGIIHDLKICGCEFSFRKAVGRKPIDFVSWCG